MILLVQHVNRHAQAESRPDAEADAVLGWDETPLSLRKPSILVPFVLLLQQQTRTGLNSRHDEGSQRAPRKAWANSNDRGWQIRLQGCQGLRGQSQKKPRVQTSFT